MANDSLEVASLPTLLIKTNCSPVTTLSTRLMCALNEDLELCFYHAGTVRQIVRRPRANPQIK